jgi:hypothetical protein
MHDWRRQLEHGRAPNHRPILSHKQHSSLRKIHSLAQLLAGAKVRDALGEYFNRRARPGVASDSRLAGTQREGTKAADLDALATGEGVAHLIEDHLYCQFDILSSEVGLLRCEAGDQFGSGHADLLKEQWGLRQFSDTASNCGSTVSTGPSRIEVDVVGRTDRLGQLLDPSRSIPAGVAMIQVSRHFDSCRIHTSLQVCLIGRSIRAIKT